MIGSIALQLLGSPWGRYLVLALSVLAALFAFGAARERHGFKRAEDKIKEGQQRNTEDGRNAFHETTRELSGLGVDDALDRMRANDSHWRRLQGLR